MVTKSPKEKKPTTTKKAKEAPVKEASADVHPEKIESKPAPKAAKPVAAQAPKVKSKSDVLAHGVGRRKSCVARVWLKRGKGVLVVNERPYTSYFDTEIARLSASMPFRVYPQTSHYDIQASVVGGGLSAQADAVKLGIARALVSINPDLRPLLRENGLLTVDSRLKERKKYGQKAARRKFQFVKR